MLLSKIIIKNYRLIISAELKEVREICVRNFSKMFELTVCAVNPDNVKDIQTKKWSELAELMPFYPIYAERSLGEGNGQDHSSLSSLIISQIRSVVR